jgi:hypothetical protein
MRRLEEELRPFADGLGYRTSRIDVELRLCAEQ